MFFFVLYYFLALRLIRFRFFKFNPKFVTSYRAHGKWGDLIICMIPISWCLNIISNSNLLLRILEWQGETGLLTIRVRGKQWYWIYKFELKGFIDIIQVGKRTGGGRFKNFDFINEDNVSMYLYFINKRNSYDSLKFHWTQYFYTPTYTYNFYHHSSYNTKQMPGDFGFLLGLDQNSLNKPAGKMKSLLSRNFFWLDLLNLSFYEYIEEDMFFNYLYLIQNDLVYRTTYFRDFFKTNIFSFLFNKNVFSFLYSEFLEGFRHVKPIRTFKLEALKVNSHSLRGEVPITVEMKTDVGEINAKDNLILNFLVIKQKRYIPKNPSTLDIINKDRKGLIYMDIKRFIFLKSTSHYVMRELFKAVRSFDGMVNLTMNKRLLRTRRLLVLPAHFNISVITNSFDVVHSWYIPGLGIKLDCVPGRSTHHNIYIPNFGFYYGQCAEICGRYHHHMPIRVCALPFEHFLIWWYNYSVNVYLSFTKKRLNYTKISMRFYSW